jgi:nucleotide-binding universal stress UspA family protein
LGAAARPRWENAAASGTAAQLLEQLACDLLVVKPEGFVSPLLLRDP